MNYEVIKTEEISVDSELEKRLFALMKKTVSSNMTVNDFRELTANSRKVEVLFCLDARQDVGFVYYGTCEINKKLLIVRSMLGMLAEYRKDALRNAKLRLARSIFIVKIKNIDKLVCIASINMNPLMYAGLCAYWRQTYPSPGYSIPRQYRSVLKQCADYFQLNMTESFVVKKNFNLLINDQDIKRMNRCNLYMDFFFSRVLSDEWNEGLFTVTPVNFTNFLSLLFRAVKMSIRR